MRRLSLHTRLALATLLLAGLGTIAAVAGAGWWSHERALTAGEEALRQSVLLLDRSVNRSLVALHNLGDEFIDGVEQSGSGLAHTGIRLQQRIAVVRHVRLAEIVDADGTVIAASDQARVGERRTDMPAFAAPLDHDETQLALTRPQRSGRADDPLNVGAGLVAVNVLGPLRTATLYVDPAYFAEAITGVTTWKNQAADLLHPDGTPLTHGVAAWQQPLRGVAADPGADNAVSPHTSASLRTDDWLVAHRWMPDLGVIAATAVPKAAVLVGWRTDLMVAIAIGGVILLVIGILTVVTLRSERKSAETEAALKSMTERLNLAFAGSNDGVWDWNTLEDRAYYSARWCALLGYDEADIAPRPQSWMDLLHPDDRPPVCEAIQQHLDGRLAVYSATHRMRRKNGDWLWVESRGKALRDDNGRASRMVGTMTDIEEKKRQELALLAARDEAEAANRAKSEFLAVMSHEIRTPMSGVLGMATVLLNTALTTKQRRFVELIKSSGENLLAILNDILDFSKLEAGHLELEAIDFYLDEEIDAVVRLMEPQARAKGIALHLDDRTGGRAALSGDPTRIRQILINLIGNAIKFTGHGSVTLRCGLRALAGEQYDVKFEVIDTGIGMDEGQRRNLFQKFSQGDPSIARRYGGTGLGLAICHQLVTLMDGSIAVTSQPNVGSQFSVTVSLRKATAVPRRSYDSLPARQRPDVADLRVLAAEDNAVNQLLLNELLSPHVAALRIVDDGESAIAAAKSELFDVVLMDVRLPGIDGVSASKAIRALGPEWRDQPIVALTANAMTEQRNAYLDAGMTACLSKPIDVEQLFATLSEVALRRTGRAAQRRGAAAPRLAAIGTGDAPGGEAQTRAEETAVTQAQAHPLLSESGLDQLRAIIGAQSVAELLNQLAGQFRDTMERVDEAADQPQALAAIAHTLAGAAGNCQAILVSKSARALEHAIVNRADWQAEIAALREAVAQTLPAIETMSRRLVSAPPTLAAAS
ncbi:MAG: ATP-binding protein [Alphaproteobacteria bacterium]